MANENIKQLQTRAGAIGHDVIRFAGIPLAALLVALGCVVDGNSDTPNNERRVKRFSVSTSTEDSGVVYADARDSDYVRRKDGEILFLLKNNRDADIQPLDTITGYVSCDELDNYYIHNSDVIMLDFVAELHENPVGAHLVMIGWYNLWSPADRNYAAGFTVIEVRAPENGAQLPR